MVKINDDYVIQIDDLNYTVMRDLHHTTIRTNRKTGEKEDVNAYKTVGYFSDFAEAIKGAIDDMNKQQLSDGVHTLEESVKIVLENNNQFYDLLKRVTSV